MKENEQEPQKGGWVWVKRLGVAGFLFFLIKGIAWLFVIFMAGKCAIG